MLILTKPLGVGIVCTASRMKDVREADYELAVKSMTTLNKYASALAGNYETHACTDVTGFGFLVHLNELLGENCSARIFGDAVPFYSGLFRLCGRILHHGSRPEKPESHEGKGGISE